MTTLLDADRWIEVVNTIVDRVPVTVVSAIVGVVVALLGATGGGIFGIPADSIEGGWRVAFGLAGLVLFLAGVWKFLQIVEIAPKHDTVQTDVSQQALSYTLVMTTPTGQTMNLTGPMDTLGKKSYEPRVTIAGTVAPYLPDRGVWIWRERQLIEAYEKEPRPVNDIYVYPVQNVRKDGSWDIDLQFGLGVNDLRIEYRVWAVIPSYDTWLLFKDHRNNRAVFDQIERRIAEKNLDLVRPWVPLPSEASDDPPTFVADTRDRTRRVIVRRG